MGADAVPAALFGASASHAPMPKFQFKFEANPAESSGCPGTAPSGLSGGHWPSAARPASGEAQLDKLPQLSQSPAVTASIGGGAAAFSAARGCEGMRRKFESLQFGVTQEPTGCTMQLDECVARCRKEVQEIAAECRARGQKYCDPDFPPNERSLYANGRSRSMVSAGSKGAAAVDFLPASWRRASEGAFFAAAASGPGWQKEGEKNDGATAEALLPGPLGGVQLLGALAALRACGKDPRELLVWREPEAGVYGVRLFKDGEWMYEILDDNLPLDIHGRPACSFAKSSAGGAQDWAALVEKAYAKIHGSYEASMSVSEAEALEDVLGSGTSSTEVRDFPIFGELWQHLRRRRLRGFVQVAMRRREETGEVLASGLISGYGYALTRFEFVDGEMLCELQNTWSEGSWNGRWGAGSHEASKRQGCRQLSPSEGCCRPFWMSAQDFCKHFTDIVEARIVPSFWQCAVVTCSSERPYYPLMSVSSQTQALFVLSQSDRRWSQHEDYANAIGLRIYRSRIVAPPENAVGLRQNVSNPFWNLELLAERPLTKAHSVTLELARLEPTCLYIAVVDSQYSYPQAVLRVLTASAPRFRVLSAPESSYFLQAQSTATPAMDTDSFSSTGLHTSASNCLGGKAISGDAMRKAAGSREADGWRVLSSDEADGIKVPPFLKACITACSGGC